MLIARPGHYKLCTDGSSDSKTLEKNKEKRDFSYNYPQFIAAHKEIWKKFWVFNFVAFLQIQTSELASMWAIFHPQIKMDRFRTQFHTLLVTKRASCYQAFGAAADRIQDNE